MKKAFLLAFLLVLLTAFNYNVIVDDVVTTGFNQDCAAIVSNKVLKGTHIIDGKIDSIYFNSLKAKLHGPASFYELNNGATDTTAIATKDVSARLGKTFELPYISKITRGLQDCHLK